VNDDSADLDRLFARLSGDGHAQNPDAHPTPEELSAYLANELSPQADDAIQEHLTQCTLCAGLLLDLQRLLDPPPEDLPREGVADLETEVEWRELRGKLRATQAPGTAPDTDEARKAPPRKILRSQAVAAVLALLLVGAVFRIVVLDRQLASPVAVQITTIEAQESKKGRPSEPTPFHLGNVAVFETHLEQPHRKLRLSFKDKNGRILRTLDAQEDENGMVALLLPSRFLALGLYRVEVREAESSASQSPRKFDIRILQ
jgi:hypothetical protein